jgi:hypothetical protein
MHTNFLWVSLLETYERRGGIILDKWVLRMWTEWSGLGQDPVTDFDVALLDILVLLPYLIHGIQYYRYKGRILVTHTHTHTHIYSGVFVYILNWIDKVGKFKL